VRALHRTLPLLDPIVPLALAAAVVAFGVLIGAAAAGEAPRMPVTSMLVIGAAAVLFSLTPEVLFLGWFAVAPLLQESASLNPIGHKLALALYQAPTLVFAIWTLTRRPGWIRPRFLDILPLAYFLALLASLMIAGNNSPFSTTTVMKGLYVAVGIGIVLYYFFAVGPIGSLSAANLTAVVLVVTVVEGGMSIIDGLTRWNLWHDTSGESSGLYRAVATLTGPAVLGILLGMGIVLAVAILVWNGPRQLRTLATLALVIGFPGLYFTLTRGPIVGTAMGVIAVLLTRTKTRLLAGAAFVLAVVVITASWGRITSSTVYRERANNSVNVQARVLLDHESWRLAKEKPLFGWGYNSFNQAAESTGFAAVSVDKYGAVITSHNTFLTVLVNQGIIGLFLLLVPWVVIPWRAFKKAALRAELRWFNVGALAAFGAYFAAANTTDFKYFSFVSAIPWVLLGLLRRHQLAER
jgi:O-antigen ligase